MIGQNQQLRFVACANMTNVGTNLFFRFFNCRLTREDTGHYRLVLNEGVGEKQLQVSASAKDSGDGVSWSVSHTAVDEFTVDVFTRDGSGGAGDPGFSVTLWSSLQPSELFVAGGD